MLSTLISRASAGVLAVGGLLLLFAPDVFLARFIPGYPPTGAWLAQLLAAAPLGLFAAHYGWLLLRGPFARDLASHAGQQRVD